MNEPFPKTIRECLAAFPDTHLTAYLAGMDNSVEEHRDMPAARTWFNVLRTAGEVEARTRKGNPAGSLTSWETELIRAAADLSDEDIATLVPLYLTLFNGENPEIPFKSPFAMIGGICVTVLQLERERRQPMVA